MPHLLPMQKAHTSLVFPRAHDTIAGGGRSRQAVAATVGWGDAVERADRGGHGARAGALISGMALYGGRFRIERLLGASGVRALYSAEDATIHRATLLAEFALPGPADIARHLARLASLDHRALPAVHAYFQEHGLLYLVLSLADGLPLDQALARRLAGAVRPGQAIAWGIEICAGLSFLAAQRPAIVLADLAPAAVLLMPDGRVKLVGLGCALGLYSPAGLVGALEPGYAAPEVYSGQLDTRSDIYALGALLFRLLTGDHPARYAPGVLPPLRTVRGEIAPELEAIVARAVAPHPQHRWPDATSFGAALGEAQVALAGQGAVLVVEDLPSDAVPAPAASDPARAAVPAASALPPFDPAAWLAAHPAMHAPPTTPRMGRPIPPPAAPDPTAPTHPTDDFAPSARPPGPFARFFPSPRGEPEGQP
jgi:serine/threonine protein kinase